MAKAKTLIIPAADAYDALCAVLPMVSKDETRPHIHGVHIRSLNSRKTPKGEDGQQGGKGLDHAVAPRSVERPCRPEPRESF